MLVGRDISIYKLNGLLAGIDHFKMTTKLSSLTILAFVKMKASFAQLKRQIKDTAGTEPVN